MKKSDVAGILTLTVILILINVSCFAQFAGCDYESDNFRSFSYTKMLVVLDGNPAYDEALKKAVNDYWKITPFQFIDQSQVSNWIENERYSFMMPLTLEEIRNNDIAVYINRFYYLSVFVGGKASLKKYDKNDLIAYAPFDHDLLEKENSEAIYRLGLMIKSMHEALLIMQREKMTGNFEQLRNSFIDYYNRKASMLAKKTLMLSHDYFSSKFSKYDFAHAFPYKYEIADFNQVKKKLQSNDQKYLMLIMAYTTEKYLFVYNLYNGEIIYASYKVVGDIFNKKEVKSMVKKAG